jgi:hypothetical protein
MLQQQFKLFNSTLLPPQQSIPWAGLGAQHPGVFAPQFSANNLQGQTGIYSTQRQQ